jgi:hypothetical protein
MTNDTTVPISLGRLRIPNHTIHLHYNQNLRSRPVCTYDSSRTRHLTHRQCRHRLQQLHSCYHQRSPASVSPTPLINPQQMDDRDLLKHRLARFRSFKKRKLTSQLRIQKFSKGWLPVGRSRHRINPDDHPTLDPVAWVETKLVTTSYEAASTAAPTSIPNSTT